MRGFVDGGFDRIVAVSLESSVVVCDHVLMILVDALILGFPSPQPHLRNDALRREVLQVCPPMLLAW